eukprot:g16288.t1
MIRPRPGSLGGGQRATGGVAWHAVLNDDGLMAATGTERIESATEPARATDEQEAWDRAIRENAAEWRPHSSSESLHPGRRRVLYSSESSVGYTPSPSTPSAEESPAAAASSAEDTPAPTVSSGDDTPSPRTSSDGTPSPTEPSAEDTPDPPVSTPPPTASSGAPTTATPILKQEASPVEDARAEDAPTDYLSSGAPIFFARGRDYSEITSNAIGANQSSRVGSYRGADIIASGRILKRAARVHGFKNGESSRDIDIRVSGNGPDGDNPIAGDSIY